MGEVPFLCVGGPPRALKRSEGLKGGERSRWHGGVILVAYIGSCR